ncbi:hypothetical protein [Polaromonas eurypsychrophila]|uniref:Uncharacterized protein n=1 Tax=Polaromonas eurypsychrophila TaxID=1614635 RepID=A0A916WF44_9BURK|nr:hypothetical protein [Polaromonas eurypsychrophila]GGA91818.1 hypothetical protein GCM10011496_10950 [Polaromonas eurypsychrophila]
MTSVSASSPALAVEVDSFSKVLLVGGLGVALDFLNTRTGYRFTFIYKCELPHARRVMVHDRELLYIPSRDLVPVTQTFFEFMLIEPVFVTADGLVDERCCVHPGRKHFRGFCGIQLFHSDGRHFGWLAHANPGPVPVPTGEVEFLHLVAPVLMQVLETMVPDKG